MLMCKELERELICTVCTALFACIANNDNSRFRLSTSASTVALVISDELAMLENGATASNWHSRCVPSYSAVRHDRPGTFTLQEVVQVDACARAAVRRPLRVPAGHVTRCGGRLAGTRVALHRPAVLLIPGMWEY